jgi:hypothetical protein
MSLTAGQGSLSPDEMLRLTDFARACKAAARVVALYPATHPAIQTSLDRVTDGAKRLRGEGNVTLTVLPDELVLDGRTAAKPDAALGELAALLHAHLIGEMRLLGDLSPTEWHTFLNLVARPAEELREQGGIARAWMAAGGGPIELRQIDYTEVLRERSGGLDSEWDRIINNYLEGELSDLDDESMQALLDIADDPGRFKEFTDKLVTQAAEGGRRSKKGVVLRVLQALADFVARAFPEQLNRILNQITTALPRLTPDLVVTLLTVGVTEEEGTRHEGIDLPGEVRSRLTDQVVAEFIAQAVSRDKGATARLAQAFQTLVPESEKRDGLLGLAEQEARNLPIGRQPDFPDLWKSAASLLTSYDDADFVSGEYARELAGARTHAIEVERVSDDPPERISVWLATVSDQELRRLDQQVLLDLLSIETRPDAWAKVLESALGAIEQLVLSGNVSLSQPLLDAVLGASQNGGPFAASASAGLDRLRSGPLMKHVVLFIRHARETELEAISAFCRALGPSVIGPLVEALANEQGAAVKRLRDVLFSFGAAGRRYADELKNSANPSVRRTAVELLRAFGGAEALPDLKALLSDAEPAIQRDALRAIMQIGTDESYAALGDALKTSNPQTRDAILQVIMSTRDERAAPLFIHILAHTDHRGPLEAVHASAIEALGRLGGDAESVAMLKTILWRSEWWAPLRTARLRTAAAMALRACGSAAAQQTLDEAAAAGSRGVRRAAKAALSAPVTRGPSGRSS